MTYSINYAQTEKPKDSISETTITEKEKECEKNNTGDYCITNKTDKTFRLGTQIAKRSDNLNHSSLHSAKIKLKPNQKKCFYDVPAIKHFYYVYDTDMKSAYGNSYDEGYIKVIKCETTNLEIE